MATKWPWLLAERGRSIHFPCDIKKGQFIKFRIFNNILGWTFPISWKLVDSLVKCIKGRKLHKVGNLRFSFGARKGSNIICWCQQRISQIVNAIKTTLKQPLVRMLLSDTTSSCIYIMSTSLQLLIPARNAARVVFGGDLSTAAPMLTPKRNERIR